MESRVDADVFTAIHSGAVVVKRRMEIYESDGESLWLPSDSAPRMSDGNITVDYERDERRAIDLVLDNTDDVLDHDPEGFWYDKVVKVYRGLEYRNLKSSPSILVISDRTEMYPSIIPTLRRLGYTDITDRAGQTLAIDDLYGYDIIVSNAGHSNVLEPEEDLLRAAYDAGFTILSIGDGTSQNHIPLITSSVAKANGDPFLLNKPSYDTPFSSGWSPGTTGTSGAGVVATGLAPRARAAAVMSYASTTVYTAIYEEAINGARWFHMQPPNNNSTPYLGLLNQAVKWLYSYAQTRSFEFQVGEFCIDVINQNNFPSLIRVTGRDYTKRLLTSKFEQSVTFTEGTGVDTIVRAVAANAGITKMMLDARGIGIGADISFERGTERWKAIKDVCSASGIEVFFDRQGYLVTRRFLDPTTSPVSVVLKTGPDGGNLAEYSKRSTDARVKNVVIVTSENQDDISGGNIWFARAANTEPTSPTRVSKLGERHDFVKTSLLRSNEECMELARQRLKISALEEFELNFSILAYPWLEVGEIARFEDPSPGRDEPDRYLLSTLTIPMKLGPMTGTGKRITVVGGGSSPGLNPDTISEGL